MRFWSALRCSGAPRGTHLAILRGSRVFQGVLECFSGFQSVLVGSRATTGAAPLNLRRSMRFWSALRCSGAPRGTCDNPEGF